MIASATARGSTTYVPFSSAWSSAGSMSSIVGNNLITAADVARETLACIASPLRARPARCIRACEAAPPRAGCSLYRRSGSAGRALRGSLRTSVHCGAGEGAGKPREGERAEHQAEVAQGNVAVAADQQQVQDDAAEPGRHEVSAEARAHENHQPGGDLDDPDHVHGVGRGAGDDVVELAREVAGPLVREHVRELVETEQDRRGGERDP